MKIECNVLCENQPDSFERMGMPEEPTQSVWLPFVFESDQVEAVKLAGPDPDSELGGIPEPKCTSVYLKSGQIFIIDIPFSKLNSQIWPKQ